jgi:hypothetical protein
MGKNPFIKAETKKKYLKISIYGGPGVGKTWLALGFPKPAIIDLEGGTDFYSDRFQFSVLDTKSFAEVLNAIEFLETGNHDFQTLIIDPITVLYESLQEGRLEFKIKNINKASSGEEHSDFTYRDWNAVKKFYKLLMNKIINLSMNVILLGRVKDETIMKGDQMIKTGYRKIDGEKSTPYLPDIYGELIVENKKRILLIEKSRCGEWDQGDRIIDPSYETFRHLVEGNQTTSVTVTHAGEEEASQKDAEFFQQHEGKKQGNGNKSQNQQQTPQQQKQQKTEQKPEEKQKTIAGSKGNKGKGNDNGKEISVKAIWTKFGNLKYPVEYQDLYKFYYLAKFKGITSMNELPQAQLKELDIGLAYALENENHREQFKKHLEGFRPKQSQTTVPDKGITMESLYGMLAMVPSFPQNYIGKWESWICHKYNMAAPLEMSQDEMIEQKHFIERAINSKQDAEAFSNLVEPYSEMTDETMNDVRYPEETNALN